MESRCAHEHTGSAEASGIPCVMALRLMPRSPRRRIRLVTGVGGFEGLVNPGRVGVCHRRLGTSNGCQDHTVLPYATRLRQEASPGQVPVRGSFSEGGNVVGPARLSTAHEVQPALRPPLRADAFASTTSHPAFVTTRDRPSCRTETAGFKPLILGPRDSQFCPPSQSS